MDQNALIEFKEFEAYQLEETGGSTKARNDPNDPIQRKVLTDRGEFSGYKVHVRLAACIHGTLDTTDNVPASLIVIHYKLQTTVEGARFTSAKTKLIFGEHLPSLKAGNPAACPEAIAYAPFAEPRRYNQTEAEMKETTQVEASGGISVMDVANFGLKLANEVEEMHTQKYFDQGKAGIHSDKKTNRETRPYWYLEQNQSQKAGISPTFRVAMLIQRKNNSKFEAKFTVEPEGGFWYELVKATGKVFSRSTYIDDPIIFDPSCDPIGTLVGLTKFELGKLKDDEDLLEGLTSVWGLDPIVPSRN